MKDLLPDRFFLLTFNNNLISLATCLAIFFYLYTKYIFLGGRGKDELNSGDLVPAVNVPSKLSWTKQLHIFLNT